MVEWSQVNSPLLESDRLNPSRMGSIGLGVFRISNTAIFQQRFWSTCLSVMLGCLIRMALISCILVLQWKKNHRVFAQHVYLRLAPIKNCKSIQPMICTHALWPSHVIQSFASEIHWVSELEYPNWTWNWTRKNQCVLYSLRPQSLRGRFLFGYFGFFLSKVHIWTARKPKRCFLEHKRATTTWSSTTSSKWSSYDKVIAFPARGIVTMDTDIHLSPESHLFGGGHFGHPSGGHSSLSANWNIVFLFTHIRCGASVSWVPSSWKWGRCQSFSFYFFMSYSPSWTFSYLQFCLG